jgi:hypothetical protein
MAVFVDVTDISKTLAILGYATKAKLLPAWAVD